VVLLKFEVVREYAQSVPPEFTFSIKVPNSITLTHHYNKNKNAPLISNPHFHLKNIVNDLLKRQHQVFINVNNHFEECAPRTIEKVKALLQIV
jgi:uncharacterized protein YecE (DUF72 family)